MRLLFTTTGAAGHLLPLVPFARAARAAGHDVAIAGPGAHAAELERTGLPVHLLADRPEDESWAIYESLLGLASHDANVRMVQEVFGRLDTRASLPGLLDVAAGRRPDLIVSEGYEFAGALAAEVHGIPYARVGTGLASMEELVLRAAGPVIGAAHAERRRRSPYITRTPLALEDPLLPGMPDTHRFGHAAEPLPERSPAGAEPLVYVSFGSVAGGLPFFPTLYRAAIDALADLPVRVLVTVGRASDPAELGPLPANVRVERWVPQGQVEREAAVIAGHGGYGSTLGAMVAGVPMVVAPLFADQPANATRVAELGAGIALPEFPTIRAAFEEGPAALGALGEAVSAVLAGPRYRRAAARVAAEARSLPPVEKAVGLLERLAAGGRPAVLAA